MKQLLRITASCCSSVQHQSVRNKSAAHPTIPPWAPISVPKPVLLAPIKKFANGNAHPPYWIGATTPPQRRPMTPSDPTRTSGKLAPTPSRGPRCGISGATRQHHPRQRTCARTCFHFDLRAPRHATLMYSPISGRSSPAQIGEAGQQAVRPGHACKLRAIRPNNNNGTTRFADLPGRTCGPAAGRAVAGP